MSSTPQEIAQKLHAEMGYSLRVGPSSIGTMESGLGLFVRGTVPVGAIVTFYPGTLSLRVRQP